GWGRPPPPAQRPPSEHRDNMQRKFVLFLLVAGLAVVLDQATKTWVSSSFRLFESRPVVEGWFHLTYLRNPGAAFGLFVGFPEAFRRPFFLAVTLLALTGILVAVWRLPPRRPWLLAALALVFGGAVGNQADRLLRGEVVDFLDVFWRGHHWPAFNLADSAISLGVTVLVVAELFGTRTVNRGAAASARGDPRIRKTWE
ncbi:MAG: signal peptidase II, partial [Thermodesulfobacteriota bacterium]